MHYYEVAPAQIIRSGSDTFTYHHESPLDIGQIVVVEVGKKSVIGVVMRSTVQPAYITKAIMDIVDRLPQPLVATIKWMSDYYATPLATVLQTVLPRGVAKSRRSKKSLPATRAIRNRTHNVLNNDQSTALGTIEQSDPGTFLLHGVTGSGKTQVYIEFIKTVMAADKSAIMLVPEIALTSQLVDELSQQLDDVIVTHSRQTEAERHLIWKQIASAPHPVVVVGPRSALFAPLQDVGAIIIDEAHEPSFKQEQAPRYSALRTAGILARHHGGKLVLGSATPLITDYYLALQSDRPIVTMTQRARHDATRPTVSVVDMTKRSNFQRHRFLSNTFLEQTEQTLSARDQALVFHNRRGTTTTTLCDNCSWSAQCSHCYTPLTLHSDKHHLRCHICGRSEPIPTSCPVCNHADIIHKGIGTKLIESELRKLFPGKTIARFDGDTATGESVDQRYQDLYDGSIDIIVGTQVIAKGLDLPHLRTVGVVQADAGLSMPDYGASERTFQLLAQVVGRVGRSQHPTSVIVQTYQPTHPAITCGVAQDYKQFYDTAIAQRHRERFPPFTHLLKLTTAYKTEAAAVKNAQKLAAKLRQTTPKTVEVLGPTPAFYERLHGTYRWQIVLKSPRRAELVDALQQLPPTHWQYELDPISLL